MKTFLLILVLMSSFFVSGQQPGDGKRILHVKFEDQLPVFVKSGKLLIGDSSFPKADLLEQYGHWESFYSIDTDLLDIYYQRAKQKLKKNLSDPNTLFEFHVKDNVDPETVKKKLENLAHIRYVSIPPKLTTPAAPDFQPTQLYLFDQDRGIHVEEFWNTYNNHGAGVKICDIEYQFNAAHLDLPAVTIIGPQPEDADFGNQHGTAVLGEIASLNNGIGTTGISYESAIYFAGIYSDSTLRLEDALISTLLELGEGDVAFIELQIPEPTIQDDIMLVPIEWYEPYYDAIQLISGNGIIVLEAAGNGNQNLDAPFFSQNNNGHYPFLEENWSEAIMVGAGSVGSIDVPLSRIWFSNYGSRVDLQGNGEEVVTTGYGDLYADEGENYHYTKVFNGTSSALPMVAGAVSLLQSLHKEQIGEPFDVDYIRDLLVSTGKPQTDGIYYPVSEKIGPLPNVFAAANEMMDQSGIEEAFDKNNFSIYPNPSNGKFSIYIPGESIQQLSLKDLSGKEIQVNPLKTELGFELENKNLEAGIYYLSLTYRDGTVVTRSIQVFH